MTPTLTVNTRGFEAMVAGMSSSLSSLGKMPGTDRIIRTFIGRILEGCIRHTKMATVAKIRKHFKSKGNRASAPGITMSINDGSRGGVAGRVWYGEDPSVSVTVTARQREAFEVKGAKNRGKVFVVMEDAVNPGAGMLRRFQALDKFRMARIKGTLRRLLEAALGARGLARNSWLQIAQKLGITLNRIAGGAQVAKAHPSTGASYQPGSGIKVEGPGQLYYEIRNSYPFEKFKIPGEEILSRSIQGELGYFEKNLKHGVFQDLAAIAKKYKGLVTP